MEPQACVVCGSPIVRARSGRPRRTCSAACRQAATLRRKLGLPESTPKRPGGGRHGLLMRGHAALLSDWEAALGVELTLEQRAALAWRADQQARRWPVGVATEYRAYKPVVIELEKRRRLLRPSEPLRDSDDPAWQTYSLMWFNSRKRSKANPLQRDELLLARACIQARVIHMPHDERVDDPPPLLLKWIDDELNVLHITAERRRAQSRLKRMEAAVTDL